MDQIKSSSREQGNSRLEFHPMVNHFPLLEGEEYEALKQDIQKNNRCFESIKLYQKKILDGRNRYKICTELGVNFTKKDLPDSTDPLAFVLSANLHRRHLTKSQRAVIALDFLPLLESQAKERQQSRLKKGETLSDRPILDERDKGRSDAQAAKALCISHSYVADIKAISKKKPDLIDRIRRGEITIQQGKRILKTQEDASDPKEQGQEQQEAEKAEERPGAGENKKTESQDFLLAYRDFLEEIKKAKASQWRTTSQKIALSRIQNLRDEIQKGN
jgi:hypothetical protein